MLKLPGIVNLVADLLEVLCLTILFHKVKEEIFFLFHIVLHDGERILICNCSFSYHTPNLT